MALDPRTLTPAAAKSMFLQQTSPANNPAQMGPRMMQPPQMAPQIRPTLEEGVMQPASFGIEDLITGSGSAAEEKAAKEVGSQIFGPALSEADPDKLMTLATDDESKVDPSLKPLYDENPDIAKTMGAIIKLQNDTSSTALLQSLVGEKGTPDSAKAEVKKFFDLKQEDEVPVWADVALAIGLDLLDPSNSTGSLLGDLAVSGKKGLVVGKARAKEKRARSDTMDKLAFGIYREDEKQRKTLGVQLAGQLSKQKSAAITLSMDLAKFYQSQEKISQTEAKNKAGAISASVNMLTADQKEKALPIIARYPNAFKGVAVEDVSATMFGLLKSKGLKLENVSDSKNIVESSFDISDKATYDIYKEAFPTQFPNEFVEGKSYKVQGFSDKSKPASELAMTNVLSVDPSIGGQDELTRLLQVKFSTQKAYNALTDKNTAEAKELKTTLDSTDGRLEMITTRKDPMTYVWSEGQLYAAGEGAAGSVNASDAARQAKTIFSQGDALGAAFGLGDNILRSLSSTPRPADAIGVAADFGKFIGGVKGQVSAVVGAFGDRASDNQSSYLNGNLSDTMLNSNERVGNTTVGKVFTNLQKLTQGNTEIQSQLMSFAYALAGSRETGKLTDKDVAAALVTFGGGDIAEGKWFANPDVLISGINQALDTATNAYAISYNKLHGSKTNIKYLKEVEKLSDDEIRERTNFDVSSFLQKNEGIRKGLADRVGLVNGRIKFQSVDAYRNDGAGNVEVPPQYTARELSFIDVLNDAARRSQLDSSDPAYVTSDQLDIIIKTVPADILEKFKNQATP